MEYRYGSQRTATLGVVNALSDVCSLTRQKIVELEW